MSCDMSTSLLGTVPISLTAGGWWHCRLGIAYRAICPQIGWLQFVFNSQNIYFDTPLNMSLLPSTGPIVQCCPNDITQEIPFGQTGANVQYPLQCNLDQNPDVQIISRSRQSGERFPVGETVVTITLQDTDNFQASCSFTIDIVPGKIWHGFSVSSLF